MHSLAALLLPECDPIGAGTPYLLSFFDLIGYFTPDAAGIRPAIPPLATPLFSSIYPFAEDADNERFGQLIRELRGRGREFYLHSLSSMSAAASAGEESSVASLISQLTGHTAGQQGADRKEQAKRWQARLILQLSLLLTEEEEEIDRALAAVSNQRKKMLAALQGIEEEQTEPTSPAEPKANILATFSDTQLRNQLYAWAYFYLCSPAAQGMLPCSSLPAVTERLCEEYEKKTRQKPVELCCLQLPSLGGLEKADYYTQRSLLQKQTDRVRSRLADLLRQARDNRLSPADLREAFDAAAVDWQEKISPEEGKKPAALRFIYLPELPLDSLLASLFPGALPAKEQESSASGVFAAFSLQS